MSWVGVLEHHACAPRTSRSPCSATTSSPTGTWWTGRAVAAGLRSAASAGDVVGLLSYNSIEFLATIFAANHLGAIAMPINWRLAAAEVRFILEHSQARGARVRRRARRPRQRGDRGGSTATSSACASPPNASPGGSGSPTSDGRRSPGARRRSQGDDLHRLMYTSGTTGRPKGVMITHANLAWKNYAHITEFGFTAADVGLACGPLYHVGALDLVTTTMIAVGATTVIHRAFDAAAVVDEIERSRVTLVWAAPAMVRAILDVPGIEERDLSSVRVIIAGGEKMPIPFIERLRRTFPSAWFADAYGLTETVSGDTFLDRESTVTQARQRAAGPCQYLELDIWDEQGASLPAGERGEVVLRGPKVFKGYWRDPEATRHGVRRRLVPHRRHRRARRGRLPLHRRPAQGHDRVRRREHRQLRGRAGALRARVGGRGRRRRPPRRAVGRGAGRLRRAATGRDDDPRGADRALPPAAREVQGAQGRRRSSTRCRGTRRARCSSGSCGRLCEVGRERGRPVHEVGRDGVAGLVVDRRPVRGDVLDRRLAARRGRSPGVEAMKMRAKRPAPAA